MTDRVGGRRCEERCVDLPVSVVIPAFNVQQWLGGAIESVIAQEYPVHEIIVVDDGSTDDTGRVAAGFSGVKVLRQENRGLAAARNAGAAVAASEALLFLDADDVLLPGALRRLVTATRTCERWGAVIPNFLLMNDGGQRVAWKDAPPTRILRRADLVRLVPRNRLAANALVRRDVWETLGFRSDLRAAEDLDFWLRMLLSDHSVITLGEPLVGVRTGRPGALTRRTALMRTSRRSVFRSLWQRPDLSPLERVLVAYQLARTSLGIRLAPADRGMKPRPRCLQVYLKEPGGGPAHVSILRQALASRVCWRECVIAGTELQSLGGWFRAAKDIAVSAERGTIVHAHGVRATAVAIPGTMVRRASLVTTVHGLHSVRRSTGRATRAINRVVLRRARRVLVLSHSDKETIVGTGLARPERVVKIRTGIRLHGKVDRGEARSALGVHGTIAILWMGRLAPEKDPLAFVHGFPTIARVRAVGLMAGDGELHEPLRRAVGSREIRLLGWVDDPSVLFAASDIFVSTSRWEGYPLAVLEAAAAGLPLILTDVPGNRDVLEDGVPAVLVSPGDSRAMSTAIEQLATNAARRQDMGRRACEAVMGRHSAEALAEDVLAAYTSLM